MFHIRKGGSVQHTGKPYTLVFTYKTLFGKHNVQRRITRLERIVVNINRVGYSGKLFAGNLAFQSRNLVLQIVALDIYYVYALLGIFILLLRFVKHML